jgi:hypothetical protein
VQALVEGLISDVMAGTAFRFSTYDEPRYRAALQLHVGDVRSTCGVGGVLAEWPGRPAGTDAARVPLLLEPWASARSGQAGKFERVPHPPPGLRLTDPALAVRGLRNATLAAMLRGEREGMRTGIVVTARQRSCFQSSSRIGKNTRHVARIPHRSLADLLRQNQIRLLAIDLRI